MKNLVNVSEITAITVEDVKAQVEREMSRFYCVVANDEEAEAFFADMEMDGYLYSEEAQRFYVPGRMNGNWQETITVVITAFYKDPGSDDYCYSVTVTED
jgi:hypothetical protein